MKVLGIIPARMASTRFPNKPLVQIGGKSMIQRVYEQAQKSEVLTKLLVATDHISIFNEVRNFGGNVMMTSNKHQNGTERCGEVLEMLGETYDVVINIQGDEPFFEPSNLGLLLACFDNESVQIATLVKEIDNKDELNWPSVVKVVLSQNKKALYFSRAPLPFERNQSHFPFYKHIGIYAFRAKVLPKLLALEPSGLEQKESLEQLRWLENDFEIYVGVSMHDSNSVDTPEDLVAIKKQFNIQDL
jgi:3-deoxy-manno-octulosonate cytidylyltransferase (CMP-KDO synthetase)